MPTCSVCGASHNVALSHCLLTSEERPYCNLCIWLLTESAADIQAALNGEYGQMSAAELRELNNYTVWVNGQRVPFAEWSQDFTLNTSGE